MINSSSSESGHVGVQTTAFNQTCDRLREYFIEKRPLQNTTTRTTMNLFPIEKQNDVLSFADDDCDQHALQDMTIFYNGRVIVIENILHRKADEIIRVATDLSLSGVGNSIATVPPPAPTRSVAIGDNSVACDLSYFARDVSQMRSHSLTRFLEKRKERINAKAPYNLRDKSWLGLSTVPEK